MEGTPIRKLIIAFSLLVFLSGCTGNGIRIYNETDEDSSKAEELFKKDERLMSVSALFYEEQLLTGVRVDTFSRFRKGKIEKELKKKLEKLYPDMDITVSADSKILYEATKLINESDQKDIGKKIDDLKSLLKEET
ncbi:hypothetical protein AB1K83_02455 [Sporosarcina sp. 179-K 3D1 HS]|uniref:hypothetical protein n=1 Tax=Sporosarcina sp. 179-K 3D1 HS TaxID=3232169 RepID=UPI0039A0F925